MRRFVLCAVLAACGSPAEPAQPSIPSNQVAAAPAATADEPEVDDIDPGELSRPELCERAMDNVVRILGLRDQREIQQTRAAGVQDCLASRATRDDLDCFLRAHTVAQLSDCHDFSDD